jgi:hypothetical protein
MLMFGHQLRGDPISNSKHLECRILTNVPYILALAKQIRGHARFAIWVAQGLQGRNFARIRHGRY